MVKAIKDNGYIPVQLPDGRWAGIEFQKEEKTWYGAVLNQVDSEGRCWWEDHSTAKTRKELLWILSKR